MTGFLIIVGAVVIGWALRKMQRHQQAWVPRQHHAFGCSLCPCSYRSAEGLARHFTHQHTNTAVFRIPHDGGPAR
jgi:hypothetical protein